MNRDELWSHLMDRYPAMQKPVVAMRQDGFRRFFNMVWREASKGPRCYEYTPNGQNEGSCSIDELAKMMGMK